MTIEYGEKTSSELVELEKQDWNLRLSAILLIFLLTFSLLIFFMPDLLNMVLKPLCFRKDGFADTRRS
jgi:Sec-independent protein secretion pathway component TatC